MGFLTRKISNGTTISRRKAQSLLEYVMVVGIISVAIFAMSPILKEGVQSVIKVEADLFANQKDAEQTQSNRRGYLMTAYSSTSPSTSKTVNDVVGDMNYAYSDSTGGYSNSLSSLGESERHD